MAEENNVVEQQQQEHPQMPVDGQEAPAPVPTPEPEKPELQYGFVVGVNKDGGVVLDMVGEKKGLIEMLGLCKYAEYHLNYTLDAASGQGAPILSQQIHQLAEMMKVLLNLIAQPRKPQNEQRIITP